jgi:hypothetical protein
VGVDAGADLLQQGIFPESDAVVRAKDAGNPECVFRRALLSVWQMGACDLKEKEPRMRLVFRNFVTKRYESIANVTPLKPIQVAASTK